MGVGGRGAAGMDPQQTQEQQMIKMVRRAKQEATTCFLRGIKSSD